MDKMCNSLYHQLALILAFLCALTVNAEILTISGTDKIKDASIIGSSTAQNLNHGGDNEIWVGRNVTFNEGALLRADYSELPAGATINSAICSLYCTTVQGVNDTVSVYEVFRDWREGTGIFTRQDSMVTWRSRGWGTGEDGDEIAIADSAWYAPGLRIDEVSAPYDAGLPTDTVVIPYPSAAGNWFTFDITSMVENQAFGQPNYGMYFRKTTLSTAGRAFFSSSEEGSNWPRIWIDYTTAPSYQSELILVDDE